MGGGREAERGGEGVGWNEWTRERERERERGSGVAGQWRGGGVAAAPHRPTWQPTAMFPELKPTNWNRADLSRGGGSAGRRVGGSASRRGGGSASRRGGEVAGRRHSGPSGGGSAGGVWWGISTDRRILSTRAVRLDSRSLAKSLSLAMLDSASASSPPWNVTHRALDFGARNRAAPMATTFGVGRGGRSGQSAGGGGSQVQCALGRHHP